MPQPLGASGYRCEVAGCMLSENVSTINRRRTMNIAQIRFLVVEDHGFQRWVAEGALKALGAELVCSAEDGAAALAILDDADQPIDIVISDLEMPQMDGMELIRRI